MALTRTDDRASPPSARALATPTAVAATVLSAVLRAAVAVAAGLLLTGGLALLLWAVTPDSGSDASGLLSGSVVAFAAAHFLPVTIGGTGLTIRPLLLTTVAVLVLASSAAGGRRVRGRALESGHALVLALSYAALVDLAVHLLVPATEARPTGAPLGVAAVGVLLGLATHRTAWRRWWRRTAPGWVRMGARAGTAAACVLAAAGAMAVVVGLVASFRDATSVASLTASSAGDGFGLLLLCLAFLPNAVASGIGYVTGVGFSLGAGSYSPLLVHPVELPAIPLLTAAPDGASAPSAALLMLGAPVLAGLIVAVAVDRRLAFRWERLSAAALASVLTGLAVAAFVAAAGGGVVGGPWAVTGAPVVLTGAAAAGILAVVSLSWSALAGLRSVPWRAARADPAVDEAAPVDDASAAPVGRVAAAPVEADGAGPVDDGAGADSAAPVDDGAGADGAGPVDDGAGEDAGVGGDGLSGAVAFLGDADLPGDAVDGDEFPEGSGEPAGDVTGSAQADGQDGADGAESLPSAG